MTAKTARPKEPTMIEKIEKKKDEVIQMLSRDVTAPETMAQTMKTPEKTSTNLQEAIETGMAFTEDKSSMAEKMLTLTRSKP